MGRMKNQLQKSYNGGLHSLEVVRKYSDGAPWEGGGVEREVAGGSAHAMIGRMNIP